MNHGGDILHEYNSYFIPSKGDTILIEDEIHFLVDERYFTSSHNRVVLIGEIEESKNIEHK